MDEQFINSIKVDYGKGHDGIGYDLGALRNPSAGEQERVENFLVRGQYQDWRDIQALDVIGSNLAREMIREGFRSSTGIVRIASAIILNE